MSPLSKKRQCRAKVALLDDSLDSTEESEVSDMVPRRNPMVKPRAQSYESKDSIVLSY